MDTLLQQLLNGLMIGSAYALMAVGLTIIFGLMDVVNFAHGEFYMVGAFLVYQFTSLWGVNYFLSIAIAVALVAAFGAAMQVTLVRPLRQRSRLNYLYATSILTIGVSIFLQNTARIVFGPVPKTVSQPLDGDPFTVAGITISPARLFVLLVSAAVIVVLALVLARTSAGRMTRATFQDREAAALLGVPVGKVDMVSFGIGAGLAALAGTLLGSLFQILPTMGSLATLKAFAVVILGGMGSFPGAIIGGFLLGMAEALGAQYVSIGYKDAMGFFIVILVLMLRPTGLVPATRRVR